MMKCFRIISTITLVALALSCKKMPDAETGRQQKICFSPSVQTKSYITSASSTEFRNGFAVYAGKTERNDPSITAGTLQTAEIMDNYKVRFDGNLNAWSYNDIPGIDPPQPDVMWSPNCDHEFLAIYPYSKLLYTFTAGDENCRFASVNTMDANPTVANPTGAANGIDIMYGRYKQYYKLGDVPAAIPLQMHHALSAISVNVRNASENDIEYIDQISLSGLHVRATDLAIDRADGDPDLVLPPTMTLDPTSIGTYSYSKTKGDATTPYIKVGDTDYKVLVSPHIIIPQEFLNLDVQLKLSVKFNNLAAPKLLTYKISKVPLQGNVADQYTYKSGKHYIYRVDILNDYINCSVSVVPWIDDKPIELT